MENEVFERDYTRGSGQSSEEKKGKEFLAALIGSGFFQVFKEEMDKIPKRIVPTHKADYEYLLRACDRYVKDYGGTIRGVVDYHEWQATIDLYLKHFEFCTEETLDLLKEIAGRAENVTFTIRDGKIRLAILVGYFDEVY